MAYPFGGDRFPFFQTKTIIGVLAKHGVSLTQHPVTIRRRSGKALGSQIWYLESVEPPPPVLVIVKPETWTPITHGKLAHICRRFKIPIEAFRGSIDGPEELRDQSGDPQI